MASLDPKERTAGSCDYCRQHKTKVCPHLHPPSLVFIFERSIILTMLSADHQCIRLESGSCRRCLRAGRACNISNTRVGRPYYQSSKEQYDLMASVVRHFFPSALLDKESLREVVAQLSASNTTEASSPMDNGDLSVPSGGLGLEFSGGMQPNLAAFNLPVDSVNLTAGAQATSTQSAAGKRKAQDTIIASPSPTQAQSLHVLTPISVSRPDEHSHDPIPPRYSNAARDSTEGSTSHRSGASHTDETFPIESIARRDNRDITRKS